MLDSERLVEAGWLLKRARALSGLSQQELAQRAGVGQSVLSRLESNAQEPGFGEVQSLLGSAGCRLSVSLYRTRERPEADWYERNDVYEVSAWGELRELIPEGLRGRGGRLQGAAETGPGVGEALYWLDEVRRLAVAACAPAGWLQAAYGDYHYERDRDLVHPVLQCGAGASQAAAALDAAVQSTRPWPRRRFARQHREERPRIGGLAYAHAVMAVRGEAVISAHLASYCRRSVEAAAAHECAHSRVRHARGDLEVVQSMRAGRGCSADHLADVTAAVVAAEDEEKEAYQNRRSVIIRGGTPHPLEVGAAGERLLMSVFAQISQQAWALYTKMAEHPSVGEWRPDPDEPPAIATRQPEFGLAGVEHPPIGVSSVTNLGPGEPAERIDWPADDEQ